MFFAARSIKKLARDDPERDGLLEGGADPGRLDAIVWSVSSYLIACTSCNKYSRSSSSGAEARVSIAYDRT